MKPSWSLSLLLVVCAGGVGVARADGPKPAWLELGLQHRERIEELVHDYRAANPANATAYVLRTLVSAKATFDPIFVAVEGEDSRAYATDTTPLSTSSVDAVELLQAHVGLRLSGVFAAGDNVEARLGRITMDVGSRRFVARNRYRNTLNAFTGVDATWISAGKHQLRLFAVVPVTRRPSAADAVANNDIQLDKENVDAQLVGLFYASPALADGLANLELFVFGLHETDGDVATSNRRLVTPGFRIYMKPAAGRPDYQVEAALQVGKSRASKADTDTTDLDHRAFFARGELGYTFAAAWKPRLVGQFDYASGDGDSADGTNGRFDTLYGARRFDFGPTGIYGPFARSNLMTPGIRVLVAPHERVDAFAAYRLYWLASKYDAWTTAKQSDPTGSSGSYLGQQAELRVRWHVVPKHVNLEAGAAYLIRGGFAVDAPDGRDTPSTLIYTSVTGTI